MTVVVRPGAQAETPDAASPPADDAGVRFVRRAMLVVGASLGFAIQPWGYDAFGRPRVAVVWTAAVIGVALLVVRRAEGGHLPPPTSVVWAALAFVGAMAVATVFSTNPLLSAVGLTSRMGGLVSYVAYAATVYLVFVAFADRLDALRTLAWACVGGSAVHSLYIVVQALGADPFRWQLPDEGQPLWPLGTAGHSNFAGGYLAIVLPLTVYLVLTTVGWARIALAGFAVLQGLDILMTFSRGGALAAATALVVFLLVRRPSKLLFAVFGGGAALVVVLATTLAIFPRLFVRFGLFALRPGTLIGRIDWWVSSVRMFLDRPLLGFGPEGFLGNYTVYRGARDADYAGLIITGKPHNVYLEHAVSGGLLLIVPFLVLVVLVIRTGIRAGRRPGQHGLLGAAFLASAVAYLAQLVVSIDVPPVAAIGWLCFGAIAALDPRAASPAGAARRPRAVVRAAVSVVAGGLVLLMLSTVVADRAMRSAIDGELGAASFEDVTADFERASRLDPTTAVYPFRHALYLQLAAESAFDPAEQLRLRRDAVDRYRAALRLQPTNVKILVALATMETVVGWQEPSELLRAQRSWDRAFERDPLDREINARYGAALAQTARVRRVGAVAREAIRHLRIGLARGTDRPEPWIWESLAVAYDVLGRRTEAADARARASAANAPRAP